MIAADVPLNAPPIETSRLGIEWPTWGVIIAVYGGWGLLTYGFDALPWWISLPMAAWLIAWHMSLQHEIIHGHPTKSPWINWALGFPPLSLWLPLARYRQLHLAHHRDHLLTDPAEDPESFYVSPEHWARLGPLARLSIRFLNTAPGRILVNPVVAIPRFLIREAKALLAGVPKFRRIWLFHSLGVAAILVWVLAVCRIPFWQYIVFFVYPGFTLASVRSFAEHRAAGNPDHRTAIVERASLFGLLFLYNNLHVVHHDHPTLPWYAIPAAYRANRSALIRKNGGLVYRGYADVIRRYLYREHHAPVLGPVQSSRDRNP